MKALLLFTLFTGLAALPAQAQLAIYADFTDAANPTIGESTDPNHINWIDVNSIDIGIETTVNIGSQSGGGSAGRAEFKEATIGKEVDRATPSLMSACAQGIEYDNVVIDVVRNTGPSTQTPIIKYEFLGTYISSVTTKNDGGDSVQEEVTFRYGAQRVTTYLINPQNGSVTGQTVHVWSQVLNEENFSITP